MKKEERRNKIDSTVLAIRLVFDQVFLDTCKTPACCPVASDFGNEFAGISALGEQLLGNSLRAALEGKLPGGSPR